MAHATAVINVVGLSESLLGPGAPRICSFRDGGRLRRLRPVLPAVTCSVQSSMLTGVGVSDHGIVGNGWYDRALADVQFWKQSNHLVQAEKVWETARRRDPTVTCANMFWWYNMYGTTEWSVTPRPIYKADGRKIPDCYSEPPELRTELQARFGRFPLFDFWGPRSSIASSRWIANATMEVVRRHGPTLTLVYLPHLDYILQQEGPDGPGVPGAVGEIDSVVGELIDFFTERGDRLIVLSEYGIEAASGAVTVNRTLREAGFLCVREEDGLELLDAGASEAFAVVDHQIAQIYVKRPGNVASIAALLRATDGIDIVLDEAGKREHCVDHARAGELIAIAGRGQWFAYDYWRDDAVAPDFARTVDIHRKPGYDPRELFVDPGIRMPKVAVGWRLLRKSLGFRQLMDVIPLDADLVGGTHGRVDLPGDLAPVLITTGSSGDETPDTLPCTAVRDVILASLLD